MLLAHHQSLAVHPIGLHLVPFLSFRVETVDVFFVCDVGSLTSLIFLASIMRYVHPDFKWTLEAQSFILDRDVPRFSEM